MNSKRFKQSTSMINLTTKAGQPIKNFVIKATDFSTYFSIFLANSKGKDKFIALFQYLFQFFCICGKNSNIDGMIQAYKKKQLLDMKIYYNLKQSISSARKVFRLFRYFDQIKGLVKILKTDKPIMFKILSVFTYLCSIMYYISDNSLWLVNIMIKSGGLDKKIGKYWKEKKNTFSLFRVIAYTIILVYSVILQKNDLHEKISYLTKSKQLKSKSHIIIQQQTNFQVQSPLLDEKIKQKRYIQQKIIQSRRKQRFLYLQLALSFCRIQMLIKSLKLQGHQWLDPIYVGALGMTSSILNFLKALFQKKIILSLDKKQQSVFSDKKMGSRIW